MDAKPVVVVTGATGLVGRRLLPRLQDEGYAVRALSRRPEAGLSGADEVLSWNGRSAPREALFRAHAIVHLAGEPVFAGRLSDPRKRRIRDSRIESARDITRVLADLPEHDRPRTVVCASAVGYYGSRGDEILGEESPPGEGFLAEVCIGWEAAVAEAEPLGVRTVSLRIGIVLAREGGALPNLRRLFSLGLGGRLGDGRQWFPWIHVDDLVSLIVTALAQPGYRGPVNATAPEPVRNAELTRELAACLRRPAWFAVPGPILHLALGELAEELLGSRRALPQRALAAGFRFAYPTLAAALRAELED
jgi:uncharacterized protein (TIGR01777 family)